jgi:hypothetical protein
MEVDIAPVGRLLELRPLRQSAQRPRNFADHLLHAHIADDDHFKRRVVDNRLDVSDRILGLPGVAHRLVVDGPAQVAIVQQPVELPLKHPRRRHQQ